MKKQNTAVRRAALAVLYLAVFAAAVMYLRVTISVPAEGDDKLTLNGWLYDMGRMSFWQYALQDLKERLSFFLLKQVRFFPFHYPNAVALLFYRTLASYRLYIIAMTGNRSSSACVRAAMRWCRCRHGMSTKASTPAWRPRRWPMSCPRTTTARPRARWARWR